MSRTDARSNRPSTVCSGGSRDTFAGTGTTRPIPKPFRSRPSARSPTSASTSRFAGVARPWPVPRRWSRPSVRSWPITIGNPVAYGSGCSQSSTPTRHEPERRVGCWPCPHESGRRRRRFRPKPVFSDHFRGGGGGDRAVAGEVGEQGIRPGMQAGHVNPVRRIAGVARQPAVGPLQQGRRTGRVAAQYVSQADGQLGQTLPEVAFGLRRRLPGRLQDLVGVERAAGVEQALGLFQ